MARECVRVTVSVPFFRLLAPFFRFKSGEKQRTGIQISDWTRLPKSVYTQYHNRCTLQPDTVAERGDVPTLVLFPSLGIKYKFNSTGPAVPLQAGRPVTPLQRLERFGSRPPGETCLRMTTRCCARNE